MYSLSVIHLLVSLAYEISRYLISCYKTEVYFSGFNPLVLCETWRMKYILSLRSLLAHYMAKKGKNFALLSYKIYCSKQRKSVYDSLPRCRLSFQNMFKKLTRKKNIDYFPQCWTKFTKSCFTWLVTTRWSAQNRLDRL